MSLQQSSLNIYNVYLLTAIFNQHSFNRSRKSRRANKFEFDLFLNQYTYIWWTKIYEHKNTGHPLFSTAYSSTTTMYICWWSSEGCSFCWPGCCMCLTGLPRRRSAPNNKLTSRSYHHNRCPITIWTLPCHRQLTLRRPPNPPNELRTRIQGWCSLCGNAQAPQSYSHLEGGERTLWPQKRPMLARKAGKVARVHTTGPPPWDYVSPVWDKLSTETNATDATAQRDYFVQIAPPNTTSFSNYLSSFTFNPEYFSNIF